MKEIYSKLSTISDLEKNLGDILSTLNIEKRKRQFNSKIRNSNRKIEHIADNLRDIDLEIEQANSLVKKIDIAQENYSNLIDNYEGMKILSTAFLNMKRTVKYADKIADKKIKPIDITNLVRYDKLRNKLMYYSKDFNKREYLIVKPIIDDLDKEFLDWECKIMEFPKKLLNPETNKEKISEVFKMINLVQKLDDEGALARRGRDGQFKERKKEYFVHNFTEEKSMKFMISESIILNDEPDLLKGKSPDESSIFAKMFFKENKYLSSRERSNLKIRFIKNLFTFLLNRELEFILSDIQILLSQEFDRNITNSIFQFLNELLTFRLQKNYESASEILKIINFVNMYEDITRAATLKFSHAIIDSSCLKSRYSVIMKNKIAIWIENITAAELKSLKSRDVSLDEEENFISTNFINLLKIVKEVLEPVTFDRGLYLSVLANVIANVKHFKSTICDALQSEYSKNLTNTISGFEEYCICIGNSGLKLTQYVTSISEYNQEEAENQSGLVELGEVFISLTKFSNSLLSKFVVFTLKPATKKLFTNLYYEDVQDVMNAFKATITDFLDDYRQSMDPYVFVTFLVDLVEQITNAFFNQMIKKKSLLYNTLPGFIEKNEKALNRTIKKYSEDDPIKFDLISISPLLQVSATEQFISELKRLKYEKNLKRDFVRSLIKKRQDLEENQRKELNDAVNTIYCDAERGSKRGFFSGYRLKK